MPITGTCCARAASGQVAAVPQSSVMNSRRLMGAYPKAKITTDYSSSGVGASHQKKAPHDRLGSDSVVPRCRPHVRFGTPERTQPDHLVMSQTCQEQTFLSALCGTCQG